MGLFTKHEERIEKFKETGDTSYIYKNELDKTFFQHDMAYGVFKDLARRKNSDKTLRDKAFNIAKSSKYRGYQKGLASLVYKLFDKNSKGSGVTIQLEFNEQLAKELHKLIIRNFNRRVDFSGFKDNIWGADSADMQLISKFNKGFRFSSCVIDIFSKHGVSIVDAFQKILDKSERKPNKIWVNKRSEFYNNFFKKWLKDNDIEMYSIHNEGKSVVAERFVTTLKTKTYKYMTSLSKNVYIDKLDDI